MKNFPLVRVGNKQKDIKFFEKYLPDKKDITTVAECFAGSFAVIRNCFYDVDNIVCADNDLEFRQRCINVFNNLEEYNNEKVLINKISKEKIGQGHEHLCVNHDEFKNIKDNLKYIINEDISCRGFIKPILPTTLDYNNLKQLYYKIKWYDDFKEVFELYKNDDKAFLFLDPPYFNSFNGAYKGYVDNKKNVIDNTGIYIDIYEFMKVAKCKVMLIVNGCKIMEHIFKEYYKDKYNKTYGRTYKKENINIYCNY